MDARFDKAQQLLHDNLPILIDYLRTAVNIYEGKLECAFIPDTMRGRLFFKTSGIKMPDELEDVFKDKSIIDRFIEWYNNWKPAMDEDGLQAFKKDLVDYFFAPIQSSVDWEAFWSEQSRVLIKAAEKGSDIQLTDRIQRLRDLIAGALVFKISCVWATAEIDSVRANKSKYNTFVSVVNGIGDIDALMASQESKIVRLMDDAILPFKLDLFSGDIKDKDITKRLIGIISSLKANELYLAQDRAEQLLYTRLSLLLDDIANNHNKYVGAYAEKKVAEVILHDINNTYEADIKAEKRLPVYLTKMVSKTSEKAGSKMQAVCKTLLGHYKSVAHLNIKLTSALAASPKMFASGKSPLSSPRALTPTKHREESLHSPKKK